MNTRRKMSILQGIAGFLWNHGRSVLLAGVMTLGMTLPMAKAETDEVIWLDGSRAPAPAGRLLSDNTFYWGEVVLTGVEYTYESEPNAPADNPVTSRRQGMPGRRLLNGVRESHSTARQPVGIRNQPLGVIFDFREEFRFNEISISTPTGAAAIEVAVHDDDSREWQTIYQRPVEESGEGPLHRVILQDQPQGRQLRIRIQADGTLTRSDGIWIWGEPMTPETFEETIAPLAETQVPVGYSFQSIQGIGRSGFSDMQFWNWLHTMGWLRQAPEQPVVWSRQSTWGEITNRPILPDAEARFEVLEMTMARNETEAATLALTNTARREPHEVTVELGDFRNLETGVVDPRVKGELRVFGAISTRLYGTVLGPMFEPENMLGRSLMHRYLTNAETIVDFPRLKLAPAGSAVLWLSVTTEQAEPGIYEAQLSLDNGPDRQVRIEVLDVTLPYPFAWVWGCSEMTHMHPFTYPDRMQRDVDYQQDIGISVWAGGPEWRQEILRYALSTGKNAHPYWSIGSVSRASRGEVNSYDDLSENDRDILLERVQRIIAQAEELGLDYPDWSVRFWDEPGMGNSHSYRILAQYVKEEINPHLQLSMNPCFWAGGQVFRSDYQAEIHEALADWYNQYIDVSIPLEVMLEENSPLMELYVSDQRPINASYSVSTHHARSECPERIGFYRRKAWNAFLYGMNGWGYYSWHRPRGNPWDDHTRRTDYQMVYPGPRGYIPTRASESLRQGWQEYRILTLLREQGRNQVVEDLLQAYREGESMQELRLRALRAAAE